MASGRRARPRAGPPSPAAACRAWARNRPAARTRTPPARTGPAGKAGSSCQGAILITFALCSRPMEDADEPQPQEPRKLDGRKLALIGMALAVVGVAAIAGAFAWKSHKQKVDETAVMAAVAETTLMLREVLAKPADAAELAPR